MGTEKQGWRGEAGVRTEKEVWGEKQGWGSRVTGCTCSCGCCPVHRPCKSQGPQREGHPLFSFFVPLGPSLIVFMAPSGFSKGVKVKQVIILDLSCQILTSASNSDTRSESHCSPSKGDANRWWWGPPCAAVPPPPGHLCVVRLCTHSAKSLLLFL